MHATLSNLWPRHTQVGLWICLSISLGLTLLLTFNSLHHRSRLEQTAFAKAEAEAAKAAAEINRVFGSVMIITKNLANDLSDGRLKYTDLDRRLRAELGVRPDIDGIAVTFQPYVYSPDLRLYQYYLSRGDDNKITVLDGATYDYTQPPSNDPDAPQTAWYHHPLQNGAGWNEPFLATGAGRVLIEYGTPFFRPGARQEPAGVVTVDYSLQGMRDLMASLQLGENGYGYVISGAGVFLSHPQSKLVAQASIFDPQTSIYDQPVRDAARRVVQGESLSLKHVDLVTEQDAWFFFEPIASTGWALGIVLDKFEIAPSAKTNVRDLVTIALSVTSTLFFAAALGFRVYRGESQRLWITSTTFAVLCMAVIVFTWFVATKQSARQGVALTSNTTIARHLEKYTQNLKVSERPISIPTGIQLTAIQFPDAKSVAINGYVWQRYPKALPDDVAKGFTMMQTLGSQILLDQVERLDRGDEEVTVWAFGTQLQQAFNPLKFPFDRRDIQIRLSPRELHRNVVFVPDLESYELLNPRLLPGVSKDISINNWQFQSSFFMYKTANDGTDLGIPSRFARANLPELYFAIYTQRTVIGPFIVYLLPALVVAGLLFAFLLSDPKPGDQPREELVTALSYTAALFFVIAVLHTALRDNIAATGVTYLEYFFILLYIMIVAVIVNTFLLAKRPDFLWLLYKNALLSKLLYWPIFSGIMLVYTLLVFVYG